MIRAGQVLSSELHQGSTRLDGAYYCSDGERVRCLLVRSPIRLDTLKDVTLEITNEGRGRRLYVADPHQGVSLLSSSDILLADFSQAPRVSHRTPNLSKMLLQQGWTLVSCSGTIGNVSYAHCEFVGKAASQHVMRIVPNPRIRSGYLFAWLSSKPGVALLKKGTYGSVIPTIEPPTVPDLPVPRLDDSTEQAIHELIERAATKRVGANQRLQVAGLLAQEVTGLPQMFAALRDHSLAVGSVQVSEIDQGQLRLDAYHYIGYAGEVRSWRSPVCLTRSLSDVTERVFEPPIFKRVRAEYGVPYLLGAEVYEAHPHPATRLARHTPNLSEYLLRRDMIVFEDAGQRYGLLGTPAYVGRTLDGCTATNNMTRIVCRSREDSGFLFALLRSEYGLRLIRRLSYGTSLPHILPTHVADVEIPWPGDKERADVAKPVLEAVDLRDEANDLENEAQALLQHALDAATGRSWADLTTQEVV